MKPQELVQVAQIRLRKLNGKKRVEPSGIAVSSNGEIAVVDKLNGRVLMYSKDGTFFTRFWSSRQRLMERLKWTLVGAAFHC